MGNTQSVQSHNFQLIKGYKLEDIWRQFDEDSPYINDKQLDLLYNIVPNDVERDELCKKFNVNDEYSLKHYMLDLITKNEFLISYMDKILLNYYFGDKFYELAIQLFPSYKVMIDEKIKTDSMLNDEDNNTDNKSIVALHFIKIKDMKEICRKYPSINILREKTQNFSMNSIDYPLEYNHMYEYGYQYRYIDNKVTNEKLYYIKFYDWCCFDLDCSYTNDINKEPITFEMIDKKLSDIIREIPDLYFCLYQTTNGFHLHIMNKQIMYDSNEYRTLSDIFNNDKWYYIFTKTNGYKLRLNKKNNSEKYVAKFIKYYIGKHSKVTDECFYYKGIYDNYLTKHLS